MGGEETVIKVGNEVGSDERLDDDYEDDREEDWEYLDHDILQRLKQNDPTVTELMVNYDIGREYDDDDSDGEFDVDNIDWEEEGKALALNTNLKALWICGDSSEADTANTVELYRAVSRNRSIRKLYLDGRQHIGTEGMLELLSSFFIHNNNLHKLHVDGFDISAKTSQLLADVFSKCKTLRNIGLNMRTEYNDDLKDDSDRVKDYLVSKLVSNLTDTNIRVFRLDMKTSKAKTKWCSALGNLLQNTSKLAVLDLDYNHISDEGAALLGNGLEKNSTLKKLSLNGIKTITSAGWVTFFGHLSVSNTPLEKLILIANNDSITNEVITTLASVVSTKTKLKHLYLSSNSISAVGWQAFFTLLQNVNHLSLEILEVNSNHIDDMGAVSMVDALANSSSLSNLALIDNRLITPVGLRAISTLLQRPDSCLTDLYVNYTGINDEAVTNFANTLVGNTCLKTLYLHHQHLSITATGWDALANTLCNQNGIESIYNSNHTLQRVLYTNDDPRLPHDLASFLIMNENENKFEVARRKIIQYHFLNGEDNIQEFVGMELGLLPHAIEWTGRDDTGHSVLYQIVRSMPSLFEYESRKKKA